MTQLGNVYICDIRIETQYRCKFVKLVFPNDVKIIKICDSEMIMFFIDNEFNTYHILVTGAGIINTKSTYTTCLQNIPIQNIIKKDSFNWIFVSITGNIYLANLANIIVGYRLINSEINSSNDTISQTAFTFNIGKNVYYNTLSGIHKDICLDFIS